MIYTPGQCYCEWDCRHNCSTESVDSTSRVWKWAAFVWLPPIRNLADACSDFVAGGAVQLPGCHFNHNGQTVEQWHAVQMLGIDLNVSRNMAFICISEKRVHRMEFYMSECLTHPSPLIPISGMQSQ